MTTRKTSKVPESLPEALGGVVARYLAGTASETDIAEINAWRAVSAEHEAEWGTLLRAWQVAGSRVDEKVWDVEAALARVRLVRECEANRTPSVVEQMTAEWPAVSRRKSGVILRTSSRAIGGFGKQTLRRWLWVGATAAIFAVIGLMTHNKNPNSVDITRTYTTTADQRASLRLDDGTRVTLAPKTTLRLVHFGGASRNVVLDNGEAYFDVARTAGSPFVVRSGKVTAYVLGTEFLIRHDANDTRVRVAVEEGKVHVTNPSGLNSGATLMPGQIGDVTDSTLQVNTINDLVPGTERAPGQLQFHDTPVATILQAISRWYGYQFRYADHALAQRPVTIVISTQSSAEALAAIAQVLAVNLTVVGDTVTLTPQSVRSPRSTPKLRNYDIWTPKQEVGR